MTVSLTHGASESLRDFGGNGVPFLEISFTASSVPEENPQEIVVDPVRRAPTATISDLPNELLLKVVNSLDRSSVAKCARVSRRFHSTTQDSSTALGGAARWREVAPSLPAPSVSMPVPVTPYKHMVEARMRVFAEQQTLAPQPPLAPLLENYLAVRDEGELLRRCHNLAHAAIVTAGAAVFGAAIVGLHPIGREGERLVQGHQLVAGVLGPLLRNRSSRYAKLETFVAAWRAGCLLRGESPSACGVDFGLYPYELGRQESEPLRFYALGTNPGEAAYAVEEAGAIDYARYGSLTVLQTLRLVHATPEPAWLNTVDFAVAKECIRKTAALTRHVLLVSNLEAEYLYLVDKEEEGTARAEELVAQMDAAHAALVAALGPDAEPEAQAATRDILSAFDDLSEGWAIEAFDGDTLRTHVEAYSEYFTKAEAHFLKTLAQDCDFLDACNVCVDQLQPGNRTPLYTAEMWALASMFP